MQSSRFYDTVFHSKKEFNKTCLVLYFGFILVTWSLLHISLIDFFENNDNILMKIFSVYAQDDGRGNGNGEVSDSNGDSGVEEQNLEKEDTQDEDVGQEDGPEQLTLSIDGQDEPVDISRLVGGGPSGTHITSQLPFGDPQSLFVSLPPLPGGPFPPGGLPPTPGSPLPPGSPIPPEGGPTPSEDLSPLARDLPPDDIHYDDDDNENKEDDKKEEEEKEDKDEDEDNDDKDNN